MGDPRKHRKKYSTPRHPWERERITEEKQLIKEYGLKNKKEIWKAASLLKNFKKQAKGKGNKPKAQKEKEQKLLLEKLSKLKLLPKDAKLDDILSLGIKDIFERRLQTQVYQKKLARTLKQARQFIIHGHIKVNDIKTNVPSMLIDEKTEDKINFVSNSKLNDSEHPERKIKIETTKITKKGKTVEEVAKKLETLKSKEDSLREEKKDEDKKEKHKKGPKKKEKTKKEISKKKEEMKK